MRGDKENEICERGEQALGLLVEDGRRREWHEEA